MRRFTNWNKQIWELKWEDLHIEMWRFANWKEDTCKLKWKILTQIVHCILEFKLDFYHNYYSSKHLLYITHTTIPNDKINKPYSTSFRKTTITYIVHPIQSAHEFKVNRSCCLWVPVEWNSSVHSCLILIWLEVLWAARLHFPAVWEMFVPLGLPLRVIQVTAWIYTLQGNYTDRNWDGLILWGALRGF